MFGLITTNSRWWLFLYDGRHIYLPNRLAIELYLLDSGWSSLCLYVFWLADLSYPTGQSESQDGDNFPRWLT